MSTYILKRNLSELQQKYLVIRNQNIGLGLTESLRFIEDIEKSNKYSKQELDRLYSIKEEFDGLDRREFDGILCIDDNKFDSNELYRKDGILKNYCMNKR